jgi:hypothetical protein
MGRKNQIGLTLSPQAIAVLDELAQQMDSSRTEVIEAIAQAQLALRTDDPKWSFYLIADDEQTTVKLDSSSSDDAQKTASIDTESPETAAPEHFSKSEPDADATIEARESSLTQEVQRLQQDNEDLKTKLHQAQSAIRTMEAQLAAPAPTPAPQTPTTTLPSPVSDVTTQLRDQLVKLRSAYAELEASLRQQQAENSRLQASLAQTQTTANIGEAQLNRWQYKTFSR